MKEYMLYDHTGKDQYTLFSVSIPNDTKLFCVHTETGDGLLYKEYIGFCRALPNIYYTSDNEHLHVMKFGQYVFFLFKGLVTEEHPMEEVPEVTEVTLPDHIYLMR